MKSQLRLSAPGFRIVLAAALAVGVASAWKPFLAAAQQATLYSGSVPALTAAVWNEADEQVDRLLAAGADPDHAPGTPPLTAWQVAVLAGHRLSIERLSAGDEARPQSHYSAVLFKTALQRGDAALVAGFLRAGASPDFGDDNALGIAAANGYVDVMRVLLDAGVDVNARDRFGETALTAAARIGRAEAVQLLLARGAKPSVTNAQGTTLRHTESPRAAAQRSLRLLQASGATFNERQRCASCHHQGMLVPLAAAARAHGFAIDETLANAQEVRLRSMLALYEPAMRDALNGDEAAVRFGLGFFGQMTSGSAWLLAALTSANRPPQPLYELAAVALGRTQLADGRWRVGAPRVPIQESDIQTTALVVRTLTAFAPDDPETGRRVERASAWLRASAPQTAMEKAYRLLGLRWAGADRRDVRLAMKALLQDQDAAGGWAQLPWMNPDAYATGLALVALHDGADLPAADGRYRRGVTFLLRTQHGDGSWFVAKRSGAFNAYFESGFPHGKHQFASFAGSAWATLALIHAGGADGA